MQLASIAGGGVLFYVLTIVTFLLWTRSRGPLYARLHAEFGGWLVPVCLSIALGLAIFVPGTVFQQRAVFLLREGIRLNRWSAEQLDRMRVVVERPVWKLVILGVFLVLPVGVAFAPRHSILNAGYLFLWMPINLLMSLRAAVKKPAELALSLFDRQGSKPLQSEHWGQSG